MIDEVLLVNLGNFKTIAGSDSKMPVPQSKKRPSPTEPKNVFSKTITRHVGACIFDSKRPPHVIVIDMSLLHHDGHFGVTLTSNMTTFLEKEGNELQ